MLHIWACPPNDSGTHTHTLQPRRLGAHAQLYCVGQPNERKTQPPLKYARTMVERETAPTTLPPTSDSFSTGASQHGITLSYW